MTGDDRDAGAREARRRSRPLVERIGLFGVAAVFALLFGAMALVSYLGGELFLAAVGAAGVLMTLWVGLLTLLRG